MSLDALPPLRLTNPIAGPGSVAGRAGTGPIDGPLARDRVPPRPTSFPPAPVPAVPDGQTAANSARPAASRRPFAARPATPDPGLRLLPLDGFHWGGAPRPGMPRTARVRGDHCLIRITGGGLRLILPSGAADHGPGRILFLPAGTAFATLPLAGATGQVLLVPRTTADRLGVPLPRRVVQGSDGAGDFSADLTALASRIGEAVSTTTARVELLSAALNRLDSAPRPESPARPGHDTRALVAEFQAMARRDLARGLTMADMAEVLGTTAAGLDAACQTQRGCSALDLIYELRLERARDLLNDRSRSLAQIAAEVGFTGAAHLNRAFMAATGRPAEMFRPG